jgi:CheY-like chemotaxis protein
MQALVIYQGRLLNSKVNSFKEKHNFERIDKINLKLSERKIAEDNFNYDKFCHDEMKKEISRTYDLIIIHLNLSDHDYGEMYGLRVACHLRLTKDLHNTNSQIIIIATDTFEDIMRLNPLGSILLSPGIKLSSRFDFTFDFNTQKLTENQYKSFIEKVNFPNPDSADNRHSIANELTLYLWSKAIGLSLDELDKEISTNLYYKWVSATRGNIFNAKASENLIKKIKEYTLTGQLNIFLIDDESEKGWEKYYIHLFNLLKTDDVQINFENIKVQKDQSQDEIINQCIKKIREQIHTPNIVLLDLRIVDSDFTNLPAQSLTGVKIAKEIEKYNKAIQIIFTTASNKISSYVSASKEGLGVDGFIIKTPDKNIHENMLSGIQNISAAHEKSKFLITVKERIEKIQKLLPTEKPDDQELNDFIEESNAYLNLAFDILYKAGNDNQFVNLAFMQIFMTLENFSGRADIQKLTETKSWKVFGLDLTRSKIVISKDGGAFKKIGNWNGIVTNDLAFVNVPNRERSMEEAFKKVRNRVFILLWFRYNVFDKNHLWHDLNDHRNNIAHNLEIDNSKSPKKRVTMLLDLILFMLNPRNVKL